MRSSSRTRQGPLTPTDRKSTRLNSSHTVIYTLSLHDALPIFGYEGTNSYLVFYYLDQLAEGDEIQLEDSAGTTYTYRSEEHTSELQSHRDLHSFPTRRSSDLRLRGHELLLGLLLPRSTGRGR